MGMGFPQAACEDALAQQRNDVERAAEMLLEQQAALQALPAHAGGGAAGAGPEPEPDGAARTLASSQFLSLHDPKAAPGYQDEVMGALRNMLVYYCNKRGLPEEAGRVLFDRLQKEAFTQGLFPPAVRHPRAFFQQTFLAATE